MLRAAAFLKNKKGYHHGYFLFSNGYSEDEFIFFEIYVSFNATKNENIKFN
ncbi:hypothetical protein [Paraliobacillus ryukyuensis]|uniref:hypothetical protein n=1 Tax=Paraliobacillus ryukyuensis TaxID=200904 RepID=UPI0015C482BA|nr:hypothetical protein [Paraliobacillus ryukyuensis]